MSDSLRDLRTTVDRIDIEIIRLIEKRISHARRIAQLKKYIYDPFREKEVMEKAEKIKDPELRKGIKAVFREIISLCRKAQMNMKVFVPSLKTYPFLLKKWLGEGVEYEAARDVFKKAREERCYAFTEVTGRNLRRVLKENLRIWRMGWMKVNGGRKRFMLLGENLSDGTPEPPAGVIFLKKNRFCELTLKTKEDLKKILFSEKKGDVSIIGFYPPEDKDD